jgi:hypothetical protein
MDTNKVNRWLTLSANVGIIAGLILVAIQINQNTQITKAQIANDYYLADMDLELAMMGDDPARSWTKAVYTPDELNNEDAAVIDRYFAMKLGGAGGHIAKTPFRMNSSKRLMRSLQ